jgi:hypothetical protein
MRPGVPGKGAFCGYRVAWSLLDTARLDAWWDARTQRVPPRGPLLPGQRLELSTGLLGMFICTFDVIEVDPFAHRLSAIFQMPFGVRNDETITIAPSAAGIFPLPARLGDTCSTTPLTAAPAFVGLLAASP